MQRGIIIFAYNHIVSSFKTGGVMDTFNNVQSTIIECLARVESNKPELSMFEISGTGNIEIRNTGGSSAAEGGMGDGGGTEKGAGIKTLDDKDKKGTTGKDADTWDPLKPKEEKEKDGE
jgi:hypothetical protein